MDLLGDIMNVIKETPRIQVDYMCHGERHSYVTNDYETIESKIKHILKEVDLCVKK